MEVKHSSNPGWENEIEEIIRPQKAGVLFRCRDCGNIWYQTYELVLLQEFYERNKTCPNCSKLNIEMTFVVFTVGT